MKHNPLGIVTVAWDLTGPGLSRRRVVLEDYVLTGDLTGPGKPVWTVEQHDTPGDAMMAAAVLTHWETVRGMSMNRQPVSCRSGAHRDTVLGWLANLSAGYLPPSHGCDVAFDGTMTYGVPLGDIYSLVDWDAITYDADGIAHAA